MIGAQMESQAGQVRWETKNVSLIVVVYLRKRPFYGLLCPTFKSTWLRLISLDKCEGEARVSSRKGKVLLSLKFKVRKYVVEIQGDFFNWASPENVSRLPPPKNASTGPSLL